MHAAISGSAEFLFPSTDTRPDSARPPITFKLAMQSPVSSLQSPVTSYQLTVTTLQPPTSSASEAQIHDLVAQLDAEFHAAAFDQPADVAGGCGALVDDEVSVRRRDARGADARTLESGAIDECAGGRRDAVGDA